MVCSYLPIRAHQPEPLHPCKTVPMENCLTPHWKGLFQIFLTTNTAVKCQGLAFWVHASHCKKIPTPDEEVAQPQSFGCTKAKTEALPNKGASASNLCFPSLRAIFDQDNS
uniref:Murine leukemia virus integrase C-terminal domain-containing protein n=1 Tax=Micrurus surinamensis TaxID=129470 RepID=A0A2D4Q3H9_MICSU